MARHFDPPRTKMEDNIIPAIEGRLGVKLKEFQKAAYKNILRGEDVVGASISLSIAITTNISSV